MSIPISSSRVDLSMLHPRFKHRLEMFFEDPRIRGRVVVTSGCRSYAKQKYLYDKYRAGRGNLAANPDWNRPDGFFKGSFHMEQPDGFSYAVDFGLTSGKIKTWEVNNIAKYYGIYPTVSSEWWHHQPRDGNDWFEIQSDIPEPEAVKKEPKMDWLGIVRLLNKLRDDVRTSPIKYRERSDRVKILQRRLGAVGFDAGVPDGIFGRGTRRAVKRFQRVSRLKADGYVGPATWKALWE